MGVRLMNKVGEGNSPLPSMSIDYDIAEAYLGLF